MRAKSKGVAETDAAELFEKAFTFFAEQGHPNPEKEIDKIAKYWLRDCLILDDEEFSEELLYLRYYNELTGEPITEPVREALGDWIECCYPGRVREIEEKRGLNRKRKVKA
jgi:hypothetical protein